jgi:hypothetical protein
MATESHSQDGTRKFFVLPEDQCRAREIKQVREPASNEWMLEILPTAFHVLSGLNFANSLLVQLRHYPAARTPVELS